MAMPRSFSSVQLLNRGYGILNKFSFFKRNGSRSTRLFTPGPLQTSMSVKQAMLIDLGSRDERFLNEIKYIKSKLLQIAAVDVAEYDVVLLPGSGTFGVESVIQSTLGSRPEKGHILILENGAYGLRMVKMCQNLLIPHTILNFGEERSIDLDTLDLFLAKSDKIYTHVSVIHSETTSGVLNKIDLIGQTIKSYLPDSVYIVDAMSSFGAIEIDFAKCHIDFLISSPNKCLESVPGFSFVIFKKKQFAQIKNPTTSLSLNIKDEYEYQTKTNGQFRFTPPVQSLLAFKQALVELEREGGPTVRYRRYKENSQIIRNALVNQLGFRELVPVEHQSHIINSYLYPEHPNFNFEKFYNLLSNMGMVIYPGKVSKAPCFRIGNIGQLYSDDMFDLVDCIKKVLLQMNIQFPLT